MRTTAVHFHALSAALLLVCALGGAPARAAFVTFAFTGSVTGGAGASIGQPLAGTFSYDTATPGSGQYASSEFFQFSLGPRTGLTAAVNRISIIDEALAGADQLILGGAPPPGVFPTGFSLFLNFRDSTHTAFSSNALSETLPLASAFDLREFQVSEFLLGFEIVNVRGTIDSLVRVPSDPVPMPVPEPPTLAILAAGIAGVAWQRRRRVQAAGQAVRPST